MHGPLARSVVHVARGSSSVSGRRASPTRARAKTRRPRTSRKPRMPRMWWRSTTTKRPLGTPGLQQNSCMVNSAQAEKGDSQGAWNLDIAVVVFEATRASWLQSLGKRKLALSWTYRSFATYPAAPMHWHIGSRKLHRQTAIQRKPASQQPSGAEVSCAEVTSANFQGSRSQTKHSTQSKEDPPQISSRISDPPAQKRANWH